MGFDCRCKKCGLDFIDMFGEFENKDNEIECPRCGNTDLWFYDEIPDEPPFDPIDCTDEFISEMNEHLKKNKDDI